MVEPSTDILAQSLSQTLEEATFVFAERVDEPPPMGGEVIQARLTYEGPQRAELVLATTEDLAATLAANLLGEEEGGAAVVGDDQDALGELLNMIAGSLVVTLFGEAPCKLGLPRVRTVSAAQHAATVARAQAVATLMEEEGRRIDLAVCAPEGA